MTAVAAPQGLLPVYHPSGVNIPQSVYQPTVSNGPTAAIYKGDPVVLSGDTSVVTIASGSAAILGVFAGCEYTDATGKPVVSPYWPGTTTGATNIKFYVYDCPFTIYEVQGAGAVANTAIGDSADTTIAAGSTSTGVSGTKLATGTLSGAATVKQFRIVGLGGGSDNAWGDAFTIVRVRIGQSQLITTPNAI